MYYESLNYYLHHECANITNQINYFSQNSESGRDQGHASLGLGNMAEISQVAWNQGGKEYFGLVNDRLLVGYEYTAKYNLGYSVTYNLVFYRCGANWWGDRGSRSRMCLGSSGRRFMKFLMGIICRGRGEGYHGLRSIC